VKGELLVALETDRPRAVFGPGRTLLLGDARGQPIGGSVTLERARPVNDGYLLKVAEFSSRTPELEALRGRSLMIPRSAAAPADADEFHYEDLRGMEVFHGEEPVGTVTALMETPGGELLVIRRGGAADLLVPFVREMIVQVDRDARRIQIQPPEGLLDL
jgi:16S rRNA processing protein RimM